MKRLFWILLSVLTVHIVFEPFGESWAMEEEGYGEEEESKDIESVSNDDVKAVKNYIDHYFLKDSKTKLTHTSDQNVASRIISQLEQYIKDNTDMFVESKPADRSKAFVEAELKRLTASNINASNKGEYLLGGKSLYTICLFYKMIDEFSKFLISKEGVSQDLRGSKYLYLFVLESSFHQKLKEIFINLGNVKYDATHEFKNIFFSGGDVPRSQIVSYFLFLQENKKVDVNNVYKVFPYMLTILMAMLQEVADLSKQFKESTNKLIKHIYNTGYKYAFDRIFNDIANFYVDVWKKYHYWEKEAWTSWFARTRIIPWRERTKAPELPELVETLRPSIAFGRYLNKFTDIDFVKERVAWEKKGRVGRLISTVRPSLKTVGAFGAGATLGALLGMRVFVSPSSTAGAAEPVNVGSLSSPTPPAQLNAQDLALQQFGETLTKDTTVRSDLVALPEQRLPERNPNAEDVPFPGGLWDFSKEKLQKVRGLYPMLRKKED